MTADAVNQAQAAAFSAPSWLLFGAEPVRAVAEFAGAQFMNRKQLPQGDGHTVVLFPGLASDARAMAPLKAFCQRLGYTAHDWGRGFNAGPRGDIDTWLDGLAADVAKLARNSTQRISLVGWSLGGIYAREVAKKLGPARTRQVITLGTPFTGQMQHTRAGLLYRLLNGAYPTLSPELVCRLRAAPEVPTTSIYSKSDGIVAWQACQQDNCHARAENVEVRGSHSGLVWNAQVFGVVAQRLAQPEGHWQPYRATAPRVTTAAA